MPKGLKGFTKENAREMQRRGAEKLKENNAKRRAMKFTIETLLTKSVKRGELATADDVLSLAEAENMNVDVQTAIWIAVVQRAMMGDMQAVTLLRDTVGEKPGDKMEIDQSLTIESWAKQHRIKL